MPEWLTIVLSILGGIGTATGIFAVWLKPLFKMRADIDKNTSRIEEVKNDVDNDMEKIRENQTKDYKARIRNEQLQKAQIKALIALLNNQISGHNEQMMKSVRAELEACLIDTI